MEPITRSDDERLKVRVYRNSPDGLVLAMEHINILVASLRTALEKIESTESETTCCVYCGVRWLKGEGG